jgi:hypothetical protein
VSELSVEMTRTELVALRETIELTPVFAGRAEVRGAIQDALRERHPRPLCIDETLVADLTRRIVPIDLLTAALRSKLKHALDLEFERLAAAEPGSVGLATQA